MNLQIHGNWSSPSKQEIRRATEFLIKALVKSNHDGLRIFVCRSNNKNLRGDHGNLHINGDQSFTIRINEDLGYKRSLYTLAHEIIHIKQLLSGDFKPKAGYAIWKGTKVEVTEHCYRDLPWEVEAWGREANTVEKYLDYKRGT